MTRPDNSHHLLRAAAARHDLAVRRTREAIDALDRSGAPLSFAAVARAAGVSKGWLYSQAELREVITKTRSDRPDALPAVPLSERATTASLRERVETLRSEVGRLREENAILREQLARRLGEERIHR